MDKCEAQRINEAMAIGFLYVRNSFTGKMYHGVVTLPKRERKQKKRKRKKEK